MERRRWRIIIAVAALLYLSGCAALLPRSKEITKSPWKSFEEAKRSFDEVVPDITTADDLKSLGFDIYNSPNVRILNYVDVATAVQSINRQELDSGFLTCINAKNNCRAYEFEPRVIDSQRNGNFWLDITNFKRKTKESGWRFRAFFLVVDNVVIYKLWGGSPAIDQEREVNNPLGPFQEAGSMLQKLVP